MDLMLAFLVVVGFGAILSVMALVWKHVEWMYEDLRHQIMMEFLEAARVEFLEGAPRIVESCLGPEGVISS